MPAAAPAAGSPSRATRVSELGGPEVDAVGFALGIERIILALESKKKPYVPSIVSTKTKKCW